MQPKGLKIVTNILAASTSGSYNIVYAASIVKALS